jgi:hypothetical protein
MQIKFTIDRFEADKAVLIDSQGKSVIWPKASLPGGMHEGSALNFDIATDQERELRDKKTAKDIINEIINQP